MCTQFSSNRSVYKFEAVRNSCMRRSLWRRRGRVYENILTLSRCLYPCCIACKMSCTNSRLSKAISSNKSTTITADLYNHCQPDIFNRLFRNSKWHKSKKHSRWYVSIKFTQISMHVSHKFSEQLFLLRSQNSSKFVFYYLPLAICAHWMTTSFKNISNVANMIK